MIYIYSCFGGTHSSSLAAAIHLNRLDTGKVLTGQDIMGIEYFDKLGNKEMGMLIFRGTDENGNKVYSLGRGPTRLILPCVESLINMLSKECGLQCKVIVSNMSPSVNWTLRIGGILSKFLKLPKLATSFLIRGARKAVPYISTIVAKTKKAAANCDKPVLILENPKY